MTGRGQEGATTAEFVTMTALVAALVGVLIASGIVPPLTRAVEAAFCYVEAAIGTGCVPGDPIASGDVEPPRCTLATNGEGVGGSVTIASVKIGGEGSYTITREGDGTGADDQYFVSLDISGSAGLEIMTGGKVEFADGLKAGKYGEVSASGQLTYAPTFEFATLEDAEAFAEETRALITGPAKDTWSWKTLVPVWGPGRIAVNQYNRIQDYDPPPPARTRLEGSVSLEGAGGLYGNGGSGEAEGSIGQSVGAVIDHAENETTLYYKIDAALAAELGLGLGPVSVDADGGVSSELVLGVTFDDDYSPSELQVGWTGQAQGGVGLPSTEGLWFTGDGVTSTSLEDFARVGLDVDAGDTWTLEATASVDLDDAGIGAIGRDVVDALLGADPVGLTEAGTALARHVRDESDVLVQYTSGQFTDASVEAGAGAKLAFGFGAKYETSSANLQDAWYRPPGGRWLDAVCGTT